MLNNKQLFGHFNVINNQIVQHLLQCNMRHCRIEIIVIVHRYLLTRVLVDVDVLPNACIFFQIIQKLIIIPIQTLIKKQFLNYRK